VLSGSGPCRRLRPQARQRVSAGRSSRSHCPW